jgi:small subunit ribosomal protein S9
MATRTKKKTQETLDLSKEQYFYGVGRRKTSTARAKYYPINEPLKIFVNKKALEAYFPEIFRKNIESIISSVSLKTGIIYLFINGGGLSAQAQAARLAIAKALLKKDEAYRPLLRSLDYLTTDIRIVEPKKAGLRKARKREQWSKR